MAEVLLRTENCFYREVISLVESYRIWIENPESVGFENVFAMHGGTGAFMYENSCLKGLKAEDVDGKQVFEWIKQQDKDALEAFDHMTTHLAAQILISNVLLIQKLYVLVEVCQNSLLVGKN